MTKHVSASPLHGSFVPGYEPAPSDLEQLVSGREREMSDLAYYAVLKGLSGREVDVLGQPQGEKVVGNFGALSQNCLGSLFIVQGRF